jgi:hypothetical protein
MDVEARVHDESPTYFPSSFPFFSSLLLLCETACTHNLIVNTTCWSFLSCCSFLFASYAIFLPSFVGVDPVMSFVEKCVVCMGEPGAMNERRCKLKTSFSMIL